MAIILLQYEKTRLGHEILTLRNDLGNQAQLSTHASRKQMLRVATPAEVATLFRNKDFHNQWTPALRSAVNQFLSAHDTAHADSDRPDVEVRFNNEDGLIYRWDVDRFQSAADRVSGMESQAMFARNAGLEMVAEHRRLAAAAGQARLRAPERAEAVAHLLTVQEIDALEAQVRATYAADTVVTNRKRAALVKLQNVETPARQVIAVAEALNIWT